VALFELAAAAAETRVIATKLGLCPPVGLLRRMVMIVVAIGAMHMGFGGFGLGFSHTGYSCRYLDTLARA